MEKYLSSNEREDVHLASVGVFHRGDNKAGSTQCHMTLRPAVHWQCQLPFPYVEHPRKLNTLRTTYTARLPWGKRRRERWREPCYCSHLKHADFIFQYDYFLHSRRVIYSCVGFCESALSVGDFSFINRTWQKAPRCCVTELWLKVCGLREGAATQAWLITLTTRWIEAPDIEISYINRVFQ